VFTVTHQDQTIVPTFQLDVRGEPRADLALLLAALMPAGLTGWQLWAWMTSPTGWLSGEVPEKVAAVEPERVRLACARRAAALTSPVV
jgi:hypothetical protein